MSPVVRKLPGASTKQVRELYLTQRERVRGRALRSDGRGMSSPVVLSFLADVCYPPPEGMYHWRVQLDCGCIVDRAVNSNDPAWLSKSCGDYYDGREVVKLEAGQWNCHNVECPRYSQDAGPVRDIVEWIGRDDEPHIREAIEIDGEIVARAKPYANWHVRLSCGHRRSEWVDDLQWKPQDGLRYGPAPKQLGLRAVLKTMREIRDHPDVIAYWRRVYAENHPKPTPFVQCRTCAQIRTVTAYQCVGPLAPKSKPKPEPAPPPTPSRASLERRLKHAEGQAAELREQLRRLGGDD